MNVKDLTTPPPGQWLISLCHPDPVDYPRVDTIPCQSIEHAVSKLRALGIPPSDSDIWTAIDDGYVDIGPAVLREYANGQQVTAIASLIYRVG